jgi:ABC-type lipoprotein export system ATPase subunit
LRDLSRELAKTVVMVTHDPRATRWVDVVFHLEKGVLLGTEQGAVGERPSARGGLR